MFCCSCELILCQGRLGVNRWCLCCRAFCKVKTVKYYVLVKHCHLVSNSDRRHLYSADTRTCIVPRTNSCFDDRSSSAADLHIWAESSRPKFTLVQERTCHTCLIISSFSSSHVFVPVAVETLGPLADEAQLFLAEIGRRATLCTADPREATFLYQRISVAIQRFNAVCLANSLTVSESPS